MTNVPTQPPTQPIVALLAQPVAANPAQFVIEKAFAHHNLDWRYLSLEVAAADLADAVRGVKAFGFRGATVAAPHETTIGLMLDHLTDTAALSGQVTMLLRDGSRMLGDNSEGRGVIAAMQRIGPLVGKRCLLLSATGAARAAACELIAAQAAEIRIVDPSLDTATALVQLLAGKFTVASSVLEACERFRVPDDIDIVVHAVQADSSAAQSKAFPSLDFDSLRPATLVADLAGETPDVPLLREAAARGCKTVDRPTALVEQMAIDFLAWTGIDPDRAVMREALDEFLGW